jgi:ATP-dependent Lon protease
VATANDERLIPEPIRNRMDIFDIRKPTPEEAMEIGRRLYVSIRSSHEWGSRFDETPSEEFLDVLSKIVPREMRTVIMRAFGNAQLAGR